MIKLSEVLSIYKADDVDVFLKRYNKYTLNENILFENNIRDNWKFLGGNSSNGSNVSLLQDGEKGVVERLTNAIDAVIEKQKKALGIQKPSSSREVIKKAFPKFYNNEIKARSGEMLKNHAYDAEKQVILYVNDGSKSNKPTFDIIDKGEGIKGEDFDSTILSINAGNKLKSDKSYLIGAFGQGGSTSLPFTYATIIVSKKDNRFYFTIIKEVTLQDYKNRSYVYFVENNNIIELENDVKDGFISDYLVDNFVNNESGTIVRMIETEISRQYRTNDMAKPGMLGDYISTELFDVGLPVNIYDNRKDFNVNSSSQERYIYGSMSKLATTKYLKRNYSGQIKINHKNQPYKIDYYILLPLDENLWANDAACKDIYQQFNVYTNPIIYTVNGQTITTERYIKLANSGLNFLKYRLLVIVNLDILGNEKYHFFTSDRAKLVNIDLTAGFLDEIIKALVNEPNLKQINEIIANKSINTKVDKDLIDDVTKEVKKQYNKYLKSGLEVLGRHHPQYQPMNEDIFLDHIDSIELSDTHRKFFKDENINYVLSTGAQKHINKEEVQNMYLYLDEKQFYDIQTSCMNGRIMFTINAGLVKPGEHELYIYYQKNIIDTYETLKVKFDVLNEMSPEKEIKTVTKDLDLEIQVVKDKDEIATINYDKVNKKITILLCLDGEKIKNEVYGKTSSTDEIKKLQNNLIKPLVLYLLFFGEKYNDIKTIEEKNNMVLAFIKTFAISFNNKDNGSN